MLLRSALTFLVFLVVLTPVRRARACGPDFPPVLLGDRARLLAELPDSAFLNEAPHLLPKPADTFVVVETAEEPEGARTGGGARETELYQSGAKAFHAGHWDEARARFQEVLALPAGERRRFSTFAAFMLGRMAGAGTELEEARQRFAEVRALVREGFDDPLGLAVASLGEEARPLLRAGDDTGAIRLYAEQAAHGSWNGTTSLMFMARAIARDEARLLQVLREPLGQRLMATYAWTRGQEILWVDDKESPTPLRRLLEALAAVPGLAGADRMAAGAWRAGRFDLAERFAGQERTPLAAWVQAKLAVRRGDKAAAERLLAEAAEGFPLQENWAPQDWMMPQRPRAHVEGERTLLALLRGDFPQAAELVLKTCSWPDIAYVAERVLTVEELQRFTAAHASSPELRCKPEPGLWQEENERQDVNAQLRLLLGRRLLRGGRGQESLEYFRGTKWEEPARKYVEALEQARSAWRDLDEAQALYSAARLARSMGMEMMGTEVAPDWAWVAGLYDVGEWNAEIQRASEGSPARASLGDPPLNSEAERARLIAHAPPHTMRFHYRSTAADLAEQAAALVPPRSQAYAALLCHAARFVARTEPERVQRLWTTYVKNGALIYDTTLFGERCPEPDFERLRNQKLAMPWRTWRLRTLAMVGTSFLLPMLGAVVLVRRKRRQ
ncbi:hypothetical protein KYC5002_22880 [Archangium violaceum]|uniref:hypothetical protein n=1 Tax=Archangium violaceum TaxID=83451 RepID=UPI002B2FCF19|nr:hypothetical protein KYC5002_22880 [Archangium gephyra]